MGDTDGEKGAWAYVEGGMGSVSNSIAKEATLHGAHIHVNSVIIGVVNIDSGLVGYLVGILLRNHSRSQFSLIMSIFVSPLSLD